MTRTFGLIGVPSSAGAHWPGQEQAPQAFRAAGIVEHLTAAGCRVVDYGDLPRTRWQPDPQQRHPHSLSAVLTVAKRLGERVDAVLHAQHVPIVLGGDCSIELGVISGMVRHREDVALLYFDGGLDLRTPEDNPEGICDSMGLAHLIGAPGTVAELREIGPRVPLLAEEKILVFGYTPDLSYEEREEVLGHYAMPRFPVEKVRGRPHAAATEALTRLEAMAEHFVIHFDVDVIDFLDFPIADVPQINAGLTFQEAIACLRVFVVSPKFAGLVITEFNPDHADEEGVLVTTFVQSIVNALAGVEDG